MTGPRTAREALIAEAIGDLAVMLDRVEALPPAMDKSHRELVDARTQLATPLSSFEGQVTAQTDKLKLEAVKYIVARTDQAARQMVEAHTQSMSETIRPLFKAAVDAALQRLAASLQHLAERQERLRRWLIYAAAAVIASNLMLALAARLWVR